MSSVRVVADSASDIPASVAAERNITIVPLVVNFGEETYEETQLDREEFWHKTERVCHPQTSQPPVGAYVEAFQRLVDEGHDVICVAITGKHSGTYNSAWTAARQFGGHVAVVDSLSLGVAFGWQVLAASEAAEAGKSLSEIVELVEEMRDRTHVIILLDTIDYLERGGRASRLMPVMKRVVRFLSIKPVINLVEGELKLLGATRSFERGLDRLCDETVALGPLEKLGVLHIRQAIIAEQLADMLSERTGYPREGIDVVETGAALSCHGGPGTVASLVLVAK